MRTRTQQLQVAGGALKPITIGCFILTEQGLDVTGDPSFGEYQGVGAFIDRTHRASGWWLADWIAYGEARPDWKAELEHLIDGEHLAEQTVRQYRYIAKKIPAEERIAGVSFSHHAVVADFEPQARRAILERSKIEGWTQSELRREAQASKRAKVIDGQAVLKGMYRVILADPPWLYGDSGKTIDGSLGKAARHYAGMTIDEICKLPVQAHALEDAILFMWVTAPMLYENPGPREVIEAWGFKPKTGFVWDKVLGNFGHYNHVTHEHVIIATRGSCLPDVSTPQPKSILTSRRTANHSEKPAEMRKIIEKHWTKGPYLELFGRVRVPGWSVFGDDARLWAEERAIEGKGSKRP